MDDGLASILRTHTVKHRKDPESHEEYYTIHINKPDDFVYDVSDIVVNYFIKTKAKSISCKEMTGPIKENIVRFFSLKIDEFIRLLEDNLQVFFMGKIPKLAKSAVIPGTDEPSNNCTFPTRVNVNSNIKADISTANILLFYCPSLNMAVKCLKCQNISNIQSDKECNKCKQSIGFVYVPVVGTDSLGFLQLKRCDFVCFNSMKYRFNCLECQMNYESEEVSMGKLFSRKCEKCFKELNFKINRIDFYQKRDIKVKEGEELPNKGTCKHYKKSYRWFRFRCCNSLYPCDVCHDEQCSHAADVALRMVCGLCSKEQSVKQECDCGMSLKTKQTGFWEGGKGNRNKATMNRHDRKKYK